MANVPEQIRRPAAKKQTCTTRRNTSTEYAKELRRLWTDLRKTVNDCPQEWRHHVLNALNVIASNGHIYTRATGKLAALHSNQLRNEGWRHIDTCNALYRCHVAPQFHGWDTPDEITTPAKGRAA